VAALARVMYCIHVLFGLFVSRALIQGVMGYKYRRSINEVSQFIYLIINTYFSDTWLIRYWWRIEVSKYRIHTSILIRQLGAVSVLLRQLLQSLILQR
jgi:hypothetical protein